MVVVAIMAAGVVALSVLGIIGRLAPQKGVPS